MRAVVPTALVFVAMLMMTRDALLAAAGVLVICFSLALSLGCFGAIIGGTWLSVYAYPAIYITIGVGVDDIFIMTQAWMQSGKVDVTERLAETCVPLNAPACPCMRPCMPLHAPACPCMTLHALACPCMPLHAPASPCTPTPTPTPLRVAALHLVALRVPLNATTVRL